MTSRWQRLEPWLLMAVAFLLRGIWPAGVAVEHFDEGVYASGFYSEHLGYQYPDQHLYAPPLFPAILRSVLYFTGGNPHSVVWVNIVLGSLLVGTVWLVVRDWFGQPAALMAGLLLATNEFAIYYSRAVLTDTSLCLWMTLGVWAGWRAIQLGGVRELTLAGALAAAAWLTKYNGWLTLAITGAGTLGMVLFERHDSKTCLRLLLRWLGTAVIALLLWSPFLWSIQPLGGYAAIASNHAGYFHGLSGWGLSALRQLSISRYYDSLSGTGLTALGALLTGWILVKESPGLVRHLKTGTLAAVLVLGLGLFPILLVEAMLAVAVTVLVLWQARKFSGRLPKDPYLSPLFPASGSGASLQVDLSMLVTSGKTEFGLTRNGLWPAIAWGTGLVLAVPLYKPYPRLLLPCLLGVLILSTSTLMILSPKGAQGEGTRGWPNRFGLFVLVAALFLTLLRGGPAVRQSSPWENREGLAMVAQQVLNRLDQTLRILPASKFEEASGVIYVLGEPGLYYHLAAERGQQGRNHLAQPASNLGMLDPEATSEGIPVFLVTGLHAHRDHPEFINDPPRELALLGQFDYRPSDLVLLDDMAPDILRAQRGQFIRLWQVTPRRRN